MLRLRRVNLRHLVCGIAFACSGTEGRSQSTYVGEGIYGSALGVPSHDGNARRIPPSVQQSPQLIRSVVRSDGTVLMHDERTDVAASGGGNETLVLSDLFHHSATDVLEMIASEFWSLPFRFVFKPNALPSSRALVDTGATCTCTGADVPPVPNPDDYSGDSGDAAKIYHDCSKISEETACIAEAKCQWEPSHLSEGLPTCTFNAVFSLWNLEIDMDGCGAAATEMKCSPCQSKGRDCKLPNCKEKTDCHGRSTCTKTDAGKKLYKECNPSGTNQTEYLKGRLDGLSKATCKASLVVGCWKVKDKDECMKVKDQCVWKKSKVCDAGKKWDKATESCGPSWKTMIGMIKKSDAGLFLHDALDCAKKDKCTDAQYKLDSAKGSAAGSAKDAIENVKSLELPDGLPNSDAIQIAKSWWVLVVLAAALLVKS